MSRGTANVASRYLPSIYTDQVPLCGLEECRGEVGCGPCARDVKAAPGDFMIRMNPEQPVSSVDSVTVRIPA